jgi:hypothetical protein
MKKYTEKKAERWEHMLHKALTLIEQVESEMAEVNPDYNENMDEHSLHFNLSGAVCYIRESIGYKGALSEEDVMAKGDGDYSGDAD